MKKLLGIFTLCVILVLYINFESKKTLNKNRKEGLLTIKNETIDYKIYVKKINLLKKNLEFQKRKLNQKRIKNGKHEFSS